MRLEILKASTIRAEDVKEGDLLISSRAEHGFAVVELVSIRRDDLGARVIHFVLEHLFVEKAPTEELEVAEAFLVNGRLVVRAVEDHQVVFVEPPVVIAGPAPAALVLPLSALPKPKAPPEAPPPKPARPHLV
jgi:hypothetical protein